MYNWTPASTPQCRERLKELMDSGVTVIGKYANSITEFDKWDLGNGLFFYRIFHENVYPHEFNAAACWQVVEFLDPSPSPEKDENGLLPCPFCGGKAVVAEHDLLYTRFIVNCESCEAESSVFAKREDAIAAWNRRAGKEDKDE